jgi:uncharacterized protein YdhG (YjbR/CyaY superfamily)
MKKAAADIDEYIAGFPTKVQKILQKVRKTIQRAAPDAAEAISYAIPTFKLNGNLVHFAGYQNHVGFYPAPQGVAEFEVDMARYGAGKGTARFPLDEPIPYDLIARITTFRVGKNMESTAAKSTKRRAAKKSKPSTKKQGAKKRSAPARKR